MSTRRSRTCPSWSTYLATTESWSTWETSGVVSAMTVNISAWHISVMTLLETSFAKSSRYSFWDLKLR
jgi:hypothetical protein